MRLVFRSHEAQLVARGTNVASHVFLCGQRSLILSLSLLISLEL